MSSASTITVAWTDGAFGDTIARQLASQLGFGFLNDEIVEQAAHHAGVDPSTISSLEHRDSLAARILRSLSSLQLAEVGAYGAYVPDESPAYREVIKDVVRAVAKEGSVVIGLHAAGVTLAGMPDLLRVFVTAPREVRVRRIVEESGLSEKDARATVDKTDADRRDYFRKFFDIDEERPTLYDLVINTGVLSTDEAVRSILAAALGA